MTAEGDLRFDPQEPVAFGPDDPALPAPLALTPIPAEDWLDPENEASDETLVERLYHIATFSPPKPRYVMRREIARGGMGRILEVYDEVLRRELAMKVVPIAAPPEATDEERIDHDRRVARFLEEACITGQLDHPGIVAVHDIATDGGRNLYFTMPFVRGHTLRRVFEMVWAEEDGWKLHRAIDVLHQVCLTVAFAHERDVIHRDLKPDNVMVGPFGEVFVMDWGLALIGERSDEGTVVGTPAYMAPEQASSPSTVGPRADVYALGAILYELLSHHVPHQRTIEARPDEIEHLIQRAPRDLIVSADAPAELIAICTKAMARDPAARYATAQSLAADLGAWLEGRVVQAHDTRRVTKVRKWRERNPNLSLALEALFGVALVSAASIVVMQQCSIRKVESKNLELDRTLYQSNLKTADLSLLTLRISDARRSLLECEPLLRNWEWRHLMLCCDSSSRVLCRHEDSVNAVATSRDGELVATSSRDGVVRLWRESDGTLVRELRGHGEDVDLLAFDPLGRWLASGSADGTVRLWSVADGSPVHAFEAGGHVRALALSNDGRWLAMANVTGGLSLASLETFEHAPLQGAPPLVSSLAFSEGDTMLVSGHFTGDLVAWSVADRSIVHRGHMIEGAVRSLATTPHAETLFAAVEKDVFELDSRTLTAVRRFHGQDVTIETIAVNETERWLVSALGESLQLWDLERGIERTTFFGHTGDVAALAFLPGERSFVSCSADTTVRVWSTETEAVTKLFGHDNWVSSIAYGPRGRRLVSGSRDGTLRIWDVRTGELLATHPTGAPVDCVAWSAREGILFGNMADPGGTSPSPLRILDPESERPWRTLEGASVAPYAIGVHEETGRILARYMDPTILIWEPGAREPVALGAEVDGLDPSETMALHPSGEIFATGSSNGRVYVRDLAGRTLQILEAGAEVAALVYSSSGSLLAAGTWGHDIVLWSTETGERTNTLHGHEHMVAALAFSPDDSRLASGSFDHTLRVWDPEREHALLTLSGHTGGVEAVVFSPDGNDLASASQDGTIRLWRTRPSPTALPDEARSSSE